MPRVLVAGTWGGNLVGGTTWLIRSCAQSDLWQLSLLLSAGLDLQTLCLWVLDELGREGETEHTFSHVECQ